jgi:hypothetical protein
MESAPSPSPSSLAAPLDRRLVGIALVLALKPP